MDKKNPISSLLIGLIIVFTVLGAWVAGVALSSFIAYSGWSLSLPYGIPAAVALQAIAILVIAALLLYMLFSNK